MCPEVWYSPHYTNAIDIWSLAFAWLATYPPGIPTRQRINEEIHAQIVKKVGDLRQAATICEDFANLLLKMLSWSARTRISASEALESPVWLKCATVKESDKPKEDVLPNIDNRSSQWLRHAQRVSRIDRKVQAYLCNGLLKRYYLRHMTEKSKRRRRMKRKQRSNHTALLLPCVVKDRNIPFKLQWQGISSGWLDCLFKVSGGSQILFCWIARSPE